MNESRMENAAAPPMTHTLYTLVISVCGGRAGSAETGKSSRESVSKHRSVESRIFQQVLAYDLGSNYLMPDVLGYDYQRGRDYDCDGLCAPLRCLECREFK